MLILKAIVGILLCVIILPVLGLFSLFSWIYFEGFIPLWAFCADLVSSFTDESYIPPIGYGGTVKRYYEHSKGETAARSGNWKEAIVHWQTAARLYDTDAMFKLGQCYENGNGVDICIKRANEYYQHAARLHHVGAMAACNRFN